MCVVECGASHTYVQIDPGKVLSKRWMRQFAHSWSHFARWVPWGRLIQGTHHTLYAGAYTLMNTQVRDIRCVVSHLGLCLRFMAKLHATELFDTHEGVHRTGLGPLHHLSSPCLLCIGWVGSWMSIRTQARCLRFTSVCRACLLPHRRSL